MFCNKCGAQNANDAAFCSSCGSPLSMAASVQEPHTSYSAPSAPATGKKNQWAAAILNLFLGIGYLYLGYNKVLGLPTILFVVVVLIVDVIIGVFTFGLASLLLAILLAYDGYVKANGQKGYLGTEPAMLYQP